jgi:hypothetical protein
MLCHHGVAKHRLVMEKCPAMLDGCSEQRGDVWVKFLIKRQFQSVLRNGNGWPLCWEASMAPPPAGSDSVVSAPARCPGIGTQRRGSAKVEQADLLWDLMGFSFFMAFNDLVPFIFEKLKNNKSRPAIGRTCRNYNNAFRCFRSSKGRSIFDSLYRFPLAYRAKGKSIPIST